MLVERSVEGVHALVKKIGETAPYITPQYVCAKLREEVHLTLLHDCDEFYGFCLQHWRSRVVVDNILAQRYTTIEMKQWNMLRKIRTV